MSTATELLLEKKIRRREKSLLRSEAKTSTHPDKKARLFTPPESQGPSAPHPQQPEEPRPSDSSPGYGDTLDDSAFQAILNYALDSINDCGLGLPTDGDIYTMDARARRGQYGGR